MEPSGDPYIEVDGAIVDVRDVQALRAVDESGSMSAAADELGRSYSRIQQRVSELEGTLGPLVSRERGGFGGGGSELTDRATDLIERFERLQAELSRLSHTEESVFAGTVVDREGMLGTVETAAGRVGAIVPDDGNDVRVSVRSDAVGLHDPSEAPAPTETSVRNRLEATIAEIDGEDGLVRVLADVDAERPLRALITEASLAKLDLSEGDTVVASFKATATRAVSTP